MNFTALQTPLFKQGADLCSFFCAALEKEGATSRLPEKSIVIIASKVVALAQNRVVKGTKAEMEKWVRKEADEYWESNYPGIWLTLKNNILIANAGIDASNSEAGKLILWPENVQEFAAEFRRNLQEKFGLKEIGVLITDSRCTPLRTGVSGVALAWSGFYGVQDERGKADLFGKPLHVTQIAVADNLASAAEVVMGNAGESTPFVLCQNAPVKFTDEPQSPAAATFPREDDIFAVFWNE